MFYVVLIIALTLACASAVGCAYVMFLEGTLRQHKRRIAELESENAALAERVQAAQNAASPQAQTDGEWWPEVVDEDDYPLR